MSVSHSDTHHTSRLRYALQRTLLFVSNLGQVF
jgi:hypothetical protein